PLDGRGRLPAEEAQAVLAQVPLLQVAAQPERMLEVARPDLDAGLADLVARLRQGPGRALDHGDARLGVRAPELEGEREPGHAPARDDDVERLAHGAEV